MKTRLQSTMLRGYSTLTRMLAPLALRRFLQSAGEDADLRARQRERTGQVAKASGELWLHAASVGEVHTSVELVRRLLALDQTLKIIISTQTVTGAARVGALFSDQPRVRHQFAPLDTRPSVRRWLDGTRPRALMLVETELWPVMLDECAHRSIPVALVNARLSESSVRSYRKSRSLFVPALQTIQPILCQSERDRERFALLIGEAEALRVTGNLKFDQIEAAKPNDRIEQWQRHWHGRPVWIAGSTHEGEEQIAIDAHHLVRAKFANALLILVPRHPERAKALFDYFKAQNEAIVWPDQLESNSQIVLIDQMGVLAGLYATADACLVGGSLVKDVGGHNLLEPAWAGRAVITGPNIHDQQSSAEVLNQAQALKQVIDAESLAQAVIESFAKPEQAADQGQRALKAAQAQTGAVQRSLDVLQSWLAATTD